MSEPKTRPTKVTLKEFLASVADVQRRADCKVVADMMQAATGEKAVLWGASIVGFGRHLISYANGSEAEWPIVGFSPRKNDLTLYIMPGFSRHDELLARLGKHKTGKSCLYLKRLADIDTAVLDELIRESVAAMAPRRIGA